MVQESVLFENMSDRLVLKTQKETLILAKK